MLDFNNHSFLNEVLKYSEGMISFFKPVYTEGRITDYKLYFLSENFKKYIHLEIDLILHKKLSEVFPVIFQNGMFEIFNSCMNKADFEINFERRIDFCKNKVRFENKAIKYNEYILLSSKEITRLKSAETKLKQVLKDV
ncbi:hypothetical protein [Aquimarina agarilytica]|uniref:hypothetical protein n=1 Tax=Aquimarina agarilytica TaxID=1087449 RepID=UPI000492A233|nr:hypothetical protein [Aquimarina agarilytica]